MRISIFVKSGRRIRFRHSLVGFFVEYCAEFFKLTTFFAFVVKDDEVFLFSNRRMVVGG